MALKMILVKTLHIIITQKGQKMNKFLKSWHPNLLEKMLMKQSNIQNKCKVVIKTTIPAWNSYFRVV